MDCDCFMRAAIDEAQKGIEGHEGGPFGSVIVKDGKIIGRGHNQVIESHDPTAHGEVQAIREASRTLGTHDLSGCELYTTCEPCPMCFSAIHWARISQVFFGASREDAAAVGFDDQDIYDILRGSRTAAFSLNRNCMREECLTVFQEWKDDSNSQLY